MSSLSENYVIFIINVRITGVRISVCDLTSSTYFQVFQISPDRSRSIQITPDQSRSVHINPDQSRSVQIYLPRNSRSTQELPGVSRSSQKQPEAARSSQELPGAPRSFQESPGAPRSNQRLPGAARSSQDQFRSFQINPDQTRFVHESETIRSHFHPTALLYRSELIWVHLYSSHLILSVLFTVDSENQDRRAITCDNR